MGTAVIVSTLISAGVLNSSVVKASRGDRRDECDKRDECDMRDECDRWDECDRRDECDKLINSLNHENPLLFFQQDIVLPLLIEHKVLQQPPAIKFINRYLKTIVRKFSTCIYK